MSCASNSQLFCSCSAVVNQLPLRFAPALLLRDTSG
jgi:hypothetical protein